MEHPKADSAPVAHGDIYEHAVVISAAESPVATCMTAAFETIDDDRLNSMLGLFAPV